MIGGILCLLLAAATAAGAAPVLVLRATAAVAQVFRMHDDEARGFERLILVLPDGTRSSWPTWRC